MIDRLGITTHHVVFLSINKLMMLSMTLLTAEQSIDYPSQDADHIKLHFVPST
jgi:hypothetical protein